MRADHRHFFTAACLSIPAGIAALVATGCASTNPPTGASRDVLVEHVENAVAEIKKSDEGINHFFDDAYGYAVYPSVGKGAIGIGGANGRGLVYEEKQLVGYSTVTQATIGLQLGGQSYIEVIFFKAKIDLDHFKEANYEFDAQATAVAATAGASADAAYSHGIVVFTKIRGGLMFEASIGGQKFTYSPLD